jgi:hypothetical protein
MLDHRSMLRDKEDENTLSIQLAALPQHAFGGRAAPRERMYTYWEHDLPCRFAR